MAQWEQAPIVDVPTGDSEQQRQPAWQQAPLVEEAKGPAWQSAPVVGAAQDVGFGPGVATPYPEGSPQYQDIQAAQPLLATQVPAETARGPTLDETVTGAIPQVAPMAQQVPLAPRGGYAPTTVPEAYHEAGGGIAGTINALDFATKQPIIDEDQAKQLAGFVATPARIAAKATGHADVEQGMEEQLGRTLSSFTTPEGLGQLAILKSPVARALFAGETLSQIPDDIHRIAEAYRSGDKKELGRAIASASVNATMGASLAAEPLGITAKINELKTIAARREAGVVPPAVEPAAAAAQPAAEPAAVAPGPSAPGEPATAAAAPSAPAPEEAAAQSIVQQTNAALDQLQAQRVQQEQAAIKQDQPEPPSPVAQPVTQVEQQPVPVFGGPGTPGAGEIPEPRVTGLRNSIIDEERARRGWLPLMDPARQAMPETWNQAMDVLERNENAGTQMVDDIRDGRKKSVDAVDHAVLAHERIRVMNEAAMEAERASDMNMTEQERDEAHARWSVLEDRLNEVDQALHKAGEVTGRALQFRQALIRDDYTFDSLSRRQRAIEKRPLTLDESVEIKKTADEIAAAEQVAQAREIKVTDQHATDEAQAQLSDTRARAARTPKPLSLDAQHAKLLTAITEHVKEGGSVADLRPLVQKLAENYVRRGITKLQPLTRALHETISKILPDITPTQVRDLFSGYGEFRPLNKDAIAIQLRDLRGQAQQAGKIKDMFAKTPPKKTGPERRVPTEHERRLLQMVNELKKKGGFTVTDPATQLKSALGAVRTRLKNQIADLTRQLFTGERPPGKGALEYDVETEKLRAMRDQVKQSLRDVAERPELTDAQRLTAATKAAERNIEYWNDRLKLAKQGVFKIDRETGKPISDPHLDAMKAKIEAVKAEIDSLKQIANPAKTPEERALASYQARLFNRMADLQDRITRGDFAPRPRKPITLDRETSELKAQAERLKRKFDEGVAKKRLENRVWWDKALEGVSKWRRAFVLSWPTVLGKLTAASGYLMAATPLEEAARTPLRYLLPGVAERAPRYGRGFHLQTEVGAIAHTYKTLFSAAAQKWRTGKSALDLLYDNPKMLPRELKDFVTNIHGALKEPARQNEFFRSFQHRLYSAGKAGADITDPLVQTKIATQAYKDANAQIFSENNMVADFINRGLSRFRQPVKETGLPTLGGKAAETAVRFALPVVKIPLNLLNRTFEYSLGTVSGSVRLARALVKGLDKVTPDEADLILRKLSRGQVGLAAMAYGYFNPTQFGGYYQPGEKRDPDDIAAGHARVLGLDIPSYLVHNPLLAQLQIGSTIRRIVDGNVTGKQKDSPGYAKAIMQAYAGVFEDTPLVRATQDNLRALVPSERDRFLGTLMQSAVPGLVEWTAKKFDTDANGDPIVRKPTGPFEYPMQAIPGLRQQVPTKEEIKQQRKLERRFGIKLQQGTADVGRMQDYENWYQNLMDDVQFRDSRALPLPYRAIPGPQFDPRPLPVNVTPAGQPYFNPRYSWADYVAMA